MVRTLMIRLQPITGDNILFRIISDDFLFYIDNGMLCLLIRIASMRRFYREHTTYLHVKENQDDIPIMPPKLGL